jgi:hypothetical protein
MTTVDPLGDVCGRSWGTHGTGLTGVHLGIHEVAEPPCERDRSDVVTSVKRSRGFWDLVVRVQQSRDESSVGTIEEPSTPAMGRPRGRSLSSEDRNAM